MVLDLASWVTTGTHHVDFMSAHGLCQLGVPPEESKKSSRIWDHLRSIKNIQGNAKKGRESTVSPGDAKYSRRKRRVFMSQALKVPLAHELSVNALFDKVRVMFNPIQRSSVRAPRVRVMKR